jgi:hypothetical protein
MKPSVPNGVPSTAPKHLPHSVVSLLIKVFNVILWMQYFPPSWKHAHVISILKPGKDLAQPPYYRPRSLSATTCNLFEKIVFTMILSEVGGRKLRRDGQFGIRPKHSTALQLRASLKGCPGTLTRSRYQVSFPLMRLRPAIPYGLKVTSKSWQSLISPRILSKPFIPTCMAGRSKRASNQSHPLVVAYGLAWLRVEIISTVLSMSTCLRHPTADNSAFTTMCR